MQSAIELLVLGALAIRRTAEEEVSLDDDLLPASANAQRLLAILALEPGQHAAAHLIERLWPGSDLADDRLNRAARGRLSKEIQKARKALGPAGPNIHRHTHDTVELVRGDPLTIDVDVERLARASQQAPDIERAIAFHRGPVLQGWQDLWVDAHRADQRAILAGLLIGHYELDELHVQAAVDWLLQHGGKAWLEDFQAIITRLAGKGQAQTSSLRVREADAATKREVESLESYQSTRLHDIATGPLRFLFIGCHHDDIELGAGVLTQRAALEGHHVTWLVLTDDDDTEARRQETLAAGAHLGVSEETIQFAGFSDGNLSADRPTVARLRKLDLRPDVVVTHSAADSHNDHRACNALARSAFREVVILEYPIHISAVTSELTPRLFVAQPPELLAAKECALAEHRSQKRRIDKRSRTNFEAELGAMAGMDTAEAFGICVQTGGERQVSQVMRLNDAPFHTLWYPLIEDRDLVMLWEAFGHQPPGIAEHSTYHEDRGRQALRDAFSRQWLPRTPLLGQSTGAPGAVDNYLEQYDVLLLGGPVNNPIVKHSFNTLAQVRWVIGYDEPRGDVFLFDKDASRSYWPIKTHAGTLVSDLAVISVMPSPFATGRSLVSCAGVHGSGTQALLEFLAEPSSAPWLLNQIASNESSVNLPVRADVVDSAIHPFIPEERQ